jgi:hypothetical protein
MIHHPVVKIFSPKMGVATSGFDFKDAVLDGKDGHIKSSSTKIKDQDVTLIGHLFSQRRLAPWYSSK